MLECHQGAKWCEEVRRVKNGTDWLTTYSINGKDTKAYSAWSATKSVKTKK